MVEVVAHWDTVLIHIISSNKWNLQNKLNWTETGYYLTVLLHNPPWHWYLLVLEGKDDLDGASIETPHTRTEAHELVEVCHPLGTRWNVKHHR